MSLSRLHCIPIMRKSCAIFTVEYGGRGDLDNCLSLSFFGDINTPPRLSLCLPVYIQTPITPTSQRHGNSVMWHGLPLRLPSLPPSLAFKDGCPGITRTPLRLNNVCQINPRIIRKGRRADGQNRWAVLDIAKWTKSINRENSEWMW